MREKKNVGSISIEKWRIDVMHQLLLAISVMHESGICHRDLKPDNIMIEISPDMMQIRVVIIDLGLATKIGDTVRDLVGSLYYMPPEVLIYGLNLHKVENKEYVLQSFIKKIKGINIEQIYAIQQIIHDLKDEKLVMPAVEYCNNGSRDIYAVGIMFTLLLGYNRPSDYTERLHGLSILINLMLDNAVDRINAKNSLKIFNHLLTGAKVEAKIPLDIAYQEKIATFTITQQLKGYIKYCYNICAEGCNIDMNIFNSINIIEIFCGFYEEFHGRISDKYLEDKINYVTNMPELAGKQNSYIYSLCSTFLNKKLTPISFTDPTFYNFLDGALFHIIRMQRLQCNLLQVYLNNNLMPWQQTIQENNLDMQRIAVSETTWIRVIGDRIFASIIVGLAKMNVAVINQAPTKMLEDIRDEILKVVDNAKIIEVNKVQSLNKRCYLGCTSLLKSGMTL